MPRTPVIVPFRPLRPLRALALALMLLLAACASVPPPVNALARAQNQLQAAREAHAADYAPVDMDFATARLAQAQAAMAAKEYAQAADLAREALVDGQLAQTRAQLAALRKQIKARSADNARLRTQLLAPAAAASPAPTQDYNGGLPEQVILPQPAEPAAAASSPAAFTPMQPNPAGGRL